MKNRSLRVKFGIDPDTFYKELEKASININIPHSFRLFSSNNYISIIDPLTRKKIAQLPIENNKHIYSLLVYDKDGLTVVANTGTNIFKWNPKRDHSMTICYSAKDDEVIARVLQHKLDQIRIIISGKIIMLDNFLEKDSFKIERQYSAIIAYKNYFIGLQNTSPLSKEGKIVLKIQTDGNVVPIVLIEDLLFHIKEKYDVDYESDVLRFCNFKLQKINNSDDYILLFAKYSDLYSYVFVLDVESSKIHSFQFDCAYDGIGFCFDSLFVNDTIYLIFGFLDSSGNNERTICRHFELNLDFIIQNEIIIRENRIRREKFEYIYGIQHITNNKVICNIEGKAFKLIDLSTNSINTFDWDDDGISNMQFINI